MITRTRPVVAFALSLVALGMLSGCAPQPEPEPTPTAVFASEEEAFKAAEETYRAYNEALDNVQFQDLTSMEPLVDLTTPEHFAEERKAAVDFRAAGIVRGGHTRVEWFVADQYLDGGKVVARSCVDNTGTTAVDAEGKSIVPAGRPTHYALKIDLLLLDGRWVISGTRTLEDPACPPS